MCYTLKYGVWNWKEPEMDAVNALVAGGYAPLVAMVLASRGLTTPQKASQFLSCDAPLPDPMRMRDMALAANRLQLAIDRGVVIVECIKQQCNRRKQLRNIILSNFT